ARTVRRHVDRAADRAIDRGRGWVRNRLAPPPPSPAQRTRIRREGERQARTAARQEAAGTLAADQRSAADLLEREGPMQAAIAAKREQLARIERAQADLAARRGEAGTGGLERADARRAARLGVRARRVGDEIAREQETLTAARNTVRAGERAERNGAGRFTEQELAERGDFLDAQASLPDRRSARPGGPRRDYRRLAGLVGHGERGWDALSAAGRRAAMLEIDARLAQRAALVDVAREGADAKPHAGRREQRAIAGQLAEGTAEAMRARGQRAPGPAPQKPKLVRWLDHERDGKAAGAAPRPLSVRAREEPGALSARERRERRNRQMGPGWRA
ncbi:MAG: hypothetical protein KGJ43_07330, partial [Acidobacteriota bacterium]|nr:hypothetical protein [Acidobacteriota bacterium]